VISALLCFPQSNRVALGIGEPGEDAGWNLHWRKQGFATEAFGFVEVGLHVIHLNIKDCVLVRLVAEAGDVAVNAGVGGGVDHRGHAGGLHLPSEELGEEDHGFGLIATADFKVHNRLAHDGGNFITGFGLPSASGLRFPASALK
jgi:hypothetical protein